jgi:hypothetical protein
MPAAQAGWLRSLAVVEDAQQNVVIVGGGHGFVRAWLADGLVPYATANRTSASWITAILALDAEAPASFVTGDESGELAGWTLHGSAKPLWRLRGHENTVTALALGGAGAIFSASLDGAVRSWTTSGRAGEINLEDAHPGGVMSLASNTADRQTTVVSGGWDGMVRHWSAVGALLGEWRAHDRGVSALATVTRSSGTVILSGGQDGAIRSWTESGEIGEFNIPHAHADGVAAIDHIQVMGRPLVITTGIGGGVRRWRLDGSPTDPPTRLDAPASGRLARDGAADVKVARISFASPFEILVHFPGVLVSAPSALGFIMYTIKRLAGFDLEVKSYRERQRAALMAAQDECARLERLRDEGSDVASTVTDTLPSEWTLTEATVVEADE